MKVQKKAKITIHCSCRRRKTMKVGIPLNVFHTVQGKPPMLVGSLLHVPWPKKSWPFPEDLTHRFVFRFFTEFMPESKIQISTKIGIGRCSCGRIVAYSSPILTSGTFDHEDCLQLIHSEDGEGIRTAMWERLAGMTGEFFIEGRNISDPEFLP